MKALTQLQNARKRKVNHHYFREIDTPEKAYWLLYLNADGGIYKGDSPNSYRLQVNVKREDRVLLERLLVALESDYQITDKEVYLAATGQSYPVSQLKINSTELCLDLMKRGITPRKSQREMMPDLPGHLMAAAVLGAFDGDGSLYINPREGKVARVELSWIGGQGLLRGIKAWIEEACGATLPPRAINQTTNGVWRLQVTDSHLIDQIGQLMYAQPVAFLERKRARFEELSKMLHDPQ